MDNKTRADLAEEKKQWTMKFFDYAESPIKEWLAEYLEESPDIVFDDYKDESDLLSVELDGKFYTLYLSTYCDDGYAFDNKPLVKHENLRKAAALMFEAVHTVYGPVIKTMMNLQHRVEDLVPRFDEKNYRFKLHCVNPLKIKRDVAVETQLKVIEQSMKLNDVKLTDENTQQITDLKNKLNALQSKQVEILNEIKQEDIDAKDVIADEINEKLNIGPFLYMILEQGVIHEDACMRRLPEFGMKYQDPDGETLIDQLKKENGIV